MFNSDKQPLETLLRWAHEGTLQLPDFQRSYVWTEDGVISLLASILRSYPVGALLTLERDAASFEAAGLSAGAPVHRIGNIELFQPLLHLIVDKHGLRHRCGNEIC